jgi:hypothetical protein
MRTYFQHHNEYMGKVVIFKYDKPSPYHKSFFINPYDDELRRIFPSEIYGMKMSWLDDEIQFLIHNQFNHANNA